MKKLTFLLGITFSLSVTTPAQTIREVVGGVIGGNKTTTTNNNGRSNGNGISIGSLSNADVVSALRQALEIGSKNAGSRLSIKDGFFGNNLVKILLPPEVRKVEGTMRQFGLGSLADELILQMNRAAEDADRKSVV